MEKVDNLRNTIASESTQLQDFDKSLKKKMTQKLIFFGSNSSSSEVMSDYKI